jgi:hypothetical protein
MLLILAAVSPANGQTLPRVSRYDVGKVYREARMQMQFDEILSKVNTRVPVRRPEHVPSPSDTVTLWIARLSPYYEPPKPVRKLTRKVETWQLVKRIERHQYADRFDRVKWAYMGNNYITPLDTTHTQIIRAYMQARFGSPTRTLVELDFSRNLQREEYIQFEYWFILNDSIPMVVMDANGPFDRGVVVACDHRYRSILYTLRQSFLGALVGEEQPAPYVDYYYNYPARRWYRTGFDGREFFTDPIGQPNLARGRPQLAPQGG